MSTNRYLAKKSVADLQAEKTEGTALKRTLGPWHLLALGVGAIIGAGIFVLTGHAAAQYAGPAIMLSFILGGITCAFAGLCYAEFAALIPIAGSAYTYSYATLGELVAWIIGWDLVLEYALGTATVAVGWAGYVTSFLHDLGLHSASHARLQPARDARRAGRDRPAGVRGQGVHQPQRGDCRGQADASSPCSLPSAWATCTRRTGIRSCRPTRAISGSSGGAASCAARA